MTKNHGATQTDANSEARTCELTYEAVTLETENPETERTLQLQPHRARTSVHYLTTPPWADR